MAASSTGFSFGTSTPAFGTNPASTATSFNFNSTPAAASTSATGFSFGSNTTGLNLSTNKSSTVTTSTGLSLGSLPSSTAGTTSFNFGTPAAAQTVAPLANAIPFGGVDTTGAKKNVTFNLSTIPPTTSSTSSVLQPVSVSTGLSSNIQGMTFAELEENINKWQTRIDEQQRLFFNEVNELKSRDVLLCKNKTKLEKLNALTEEAVNKQQVLDIELNSVTQQQKELEEHLAVLEKVLEKVEGDIPVDQERIQTYKLAESLDLQMKKMNEELKEIIENLNEQNRCQDTSDPMVQIARIVNAQVKSLQRLEQKCGEVNKDIETINGIQKKL